METMNIALTADQKRFVQMTTESDGYSSVSEYMRQLIREDQRRRDKARLERDLLDAIKENATELTDTDWESIRARGRQLALEMKRGD